MSNSVVILLSSTGYAVRAVAQLGRIDMGVFQEIPSVHNAWTPPERFQWVMSGDPLSDAIDSSANVRFQSVAFPGTYLSTRSTTDGTLALRPYATTDDQATLQIWNITIARGNAPAWWGWLQYTPGGAIVKATIPDAFQTVPGGCAIRPNFNYDFNLNILGDGPYHIGSTVAAWDGWGGGNANEVWFPLTYVTPPSFPPLDPPDGKPQI
jgi:hypothetical protein